MGLVKKMDTIIIENQTDKKMEIKGKLRLHEDYIAGAFLS